MKMIFIFGDAPVCVLTIQFIPLTLYIFHLSSICYFDYLSVVQLEATDNKPSGLLSSSLNRYTMISLLF